MTDAPNDHPMVGPDRLHPVHDALGRAAGLSAGEALPHLREAADALTLVVDECLAEAVLSGGSSLRAAGASAGLSENAVGPRLARTTRLGGYANDSGRVTAAGVERAKYDREAGTPRPAPPTTPMRFKPRRPSS